MPLALECQIGDRNSFRLQGIDHGLGLVRRHHLVVQALQKNNRAVELAGVIDRRPLAVQSLALRQGSDNPVEIPAFKLVGVPGQGHQVTDTVVAGARREGVTER